MSVIPHRRFLLLGLLALAAPAVLAAPALTLCYNKDASYPWADPKRPGLAVRMARLVGARAGMDVQLTSMPGPRCLLEVKTGHFDGAVGVSANIERRSYGQFPEDERGQIDPARRLFSDQFIVVRPKGSKVAWDGTTMQPPGTRLAATFQVSVVARLRALGLAVDDGTKTSEATLRKVVLARADAAVMLLHGADFELARFPDLAAQLEIAGPPVDERHYYLMLGSAVDAATAKRIWDACEQVRNSPEFAAEQKAFFNGQ